MRDVPRGLLDTSVVIDLPLLPADVLPAESAISTITVAELAAGPHATADAAERAARQQRLQWVEGTFDALPFDIDAARAYGRLYATTLAAERSARRRVTGLLIAAVAVSHGLPVITRNPADFAGLDPVVEVIAV